MSMNNTINLLDVDNDHLIEVFQKALVILSKDYGERTADEDEWVEKEPNLFRMFAGGSEGSVEQLNTIKSEVNRLKSLTQFVIVHDWLLYTYNRVLSASLWGSVIVKKISVERKGAREYIW